MQQAHDEKNECNVGDMVKITSCRYEFVSPVPPDVTKLMLIV